VKVEAGRGKGHIGGATPVVIKDKLGVLYGWKNLERVYGGTETHQVLYLEGVELDVYLAWLQVNYADNEVFKAVEAYGKEHKTIGTQQLRELDAAIEITEAQAREIAALQDDVNAGKVDQWNFERGKGPLPDY
jgi:hypothetical protein